jgi:hypothetical protein
MPDVIEERIALPSRGSAFPEIGADTRLPSAMVDIPVMGASLSFSHSFFVFPFLRRFLRLYPGSSIMRNPYMP